MQKSGSDPCPEEPVQTLQEAFKGAARQTWQCEDREIEKIITILMFLCGCAGGKFNVSLRIFICRSDIPADAFYTKHHLGEKQTGQV
jgi:hypothetical protein